MNITKESVLKTLKSLSMPTWIKRVFEMIINYVGSVSDMIANKADLIDGKVPASQLPSYVDDVMDFNSIIGASLKLNTIIGNDTYKNKVYIINGTTTTEDAIGYKYPYSIIKFGENTSEDDWIVESLIEDKIYINTSNNHSYRWSGSQFVDLDKDWSDKITVLQDATYSIDIGIVTDKNDLSTNNANQTILRKLYNFILKNGDADVYKLASVLFSVNNINKYSLPIFDRTFDDKTFKVYNDGALQTYKIVLDDTIYKIVKVNEIPGYAFFNADDIENNKRVISKLEVGKSVPASLKGEFIYSGYATKTSTITNLIMCLNTEFRLYNINNNSGVLSPIKTIRLTETVLYDEIRGAKTSTEAKQEFANILKGDTVVLDFSNAGSTLDANTINNLKKASQVILLNDDASKKNSKSVYNIVARTNTYLYFCRVQNLSSNGINIAYNELVVNLSNSVWNINLRKFVLPYGGYVGAGHSIKTFTEVNNTLGDALVANYAVVQQSDLGTTISGEALTKIINASYLLIVETSGKVRVFVRGYDLNNNIYYNSVRSGSGVDFILLNATTGAISTINQMDFGNATFDKYKAFGGTKTSVDKFYTELVAQLTENTMIISASKLTTTLTDAEHAQILTASTIIIPDYTGFILKLTKGYESASEIYFMNNKVGSGGEITVNRLIYNVSTKVLSNVQTVVCNPYQYYVGKNGIASSAEFVNVNRALYDNIYIIDEALIGTIITDTAIQDGIKRASILLVRRLDGAKLIAYNYCSIPENNVVAFDSSILYQDSILCRRIGFNVSNNQLYIIESYVKSSFSTYKNAGGTKYTNEADFNAQFVKIMDMTVTQ